MHEGSLQDSLHHHMLTIQQDTLIVMEAPAIQQMFLITLTRAHHAAATIGRQEVQ